MNQRIRSVRLRLNRPLSNTPDERPVQKGDTARPFHAGNKLYSKGKTRLRNAVSSFANAEAAHQSASWTIAE
jgi:hypothetical protein